VYGLRAANRDRAVLTPPGQPLDQNFHLSGHHPVIASRRHYPQPAAHSQSTCRLLGGELSWPSRNGMRGSTSVLILHKHCVPLKYGFSSLLCLSYVIHLRRSYLFSNSVLFLGLSSLYILYIIYVFYIYCLFSLFCYQLIVKCIQNERVYRVRVVFIVYLREVKRAGVY